jgi:hypothetical protein
MLYYARTDTEEECLEGDMERFVGIAEEFSKAKKDGTEPKGRSVNL